MKRNLIILLIVLGLCVGCSQKQTGEYQKLNPKSDSSISYKISDEPTNYVLIDTNKGSLIAELYPDIAPITVENFKKLVSEGFYTKLTFHRIINNFMVQTGDPTATGQGGSKESIKGEFKSNGVENNLKHTRGVLSMARTQDDKNSASSQFFICQVDYPSLDGEYASFGKVLEGIEVVDKLASVQVDQNDKPTIRQTLKSIKFISIEGEE